MKNVTELGPPNAPTAIADTGATGHFLAFDTPKLKSEPTKNPITVELPDKSKIVSTHTTELYLPPLAPSARIVHLFPALQTQVCCPSPSCVTLAALLFSPKTM